MVNPRSIFSPSFGIHVDSLVMSSTSFHFGWNWNNGVSATPINITGSVNPYRVFQLLKGSNIYRGLPFLGGIHSLGSFPLVRGKNAFGSLSFPINVNILGIFLFPRGTYAPSNIFQEGVNYLYEGNIYQGIYSPSLSLYIGGPYDPFGLNFTNLWSSH